MKIYLLIFLSVLIGVGGYGQTIIALSPTNICSSVGGVTLMSNKAPALYSYVWTNNTTGVTDTVVGSQTYLATTSGSYTVTWVKGGSTMGPSNTISVNIDTPNTTLICTTTGATLNGNTFSHCNVSTPQNFTFTYDGGGITEIINTLSSTTNFPTATFPITYTYPFGQNPLTFTVTDAAGCTASEDYQVFVGNTPKGGLQLLGNYIGCTGDSLPIAFDSTVANNPQGTNYTITISDGTTLNYTQQQIDNLLLFPLPTGLPIGTLGFYHTFTSTSCGFPGNNFSVNCLIENPCNLQGVSSLINGIYISQTPQPAFTISPQDTVCVGSTITLKNTGPSNTYANSQTGQCQQEPSVWQITPSSGWNPLFGTSLGNDGGGSTDPGTWSFGSSPLYIDFTSPGVYTITLKEGTLACDTVIKSITHTICVDTIPTASFKLSDTSGCAPLTSNVIDLTTNTPTCGSNTYMWTVTPSLTAGCLPNIGLGYAYQGTTSDTSRTPTFLFTDPGVYIITLVVTGPEGDCASSPVSDTVTVFGKPNITALGIPAGICQMQSFTPSATVGCLNDPPTKYLWKFPFGNPDSSNNLTPGFIVYDTSGTFKDSLTASNSCGDTIAIQPLTVNPVPVIAFKDSTNPSSCGTNTGSITLTVTGLNNGDGYTINYTNPTPGSQSGTYNGSGTIILTGLSAGSYSNITLTSPEGCTSTDVGPVTLSDPNPPPTPKASSNSPVCSGNTVQLTASSSLVSPSYTWSGIGITNPTVQNPSFIGTTNLAGTYSVTVTNNGCTSNPAIITVQIDSTPVTPTITSTSPICKGSQFTLTASSSITPVTYSWTPTEPNQPTVTLTATASMTYTLVETNVVTTPLANSCPSLPGSILVTVNPTPDITNYTPNNPTKCGASDGSIVLDGLTAGDTYNVYYTDGSGSQTTLTGITAVGPGTVTISGLTTAGSPYKDIDVVDATTQCMSNTVGPVTLTDPNPPPAPNATSNSPVCAGGELKLFCSTVNGAMYSWTGPSGFMSGAQDTMIKPASVNNSGTYKVTVTVSGCTSLADSVIVVVNANANVPTVTSNSPVCFDDSIYLSATSAPVGSGPITYQWTGSCIPTNNSTDSIQHFIASNLNCTGKYCVTAYNAGCPSPSSSCDSVKVNPNPVISSTTYINPTSCGTSTGSITLYGLLKVTDYMLQYTFNNKPFGPVPITSNPDGVYVIDALPAGIYSDIEITTLQGCHSNAVSDTLVALLTVPTVSSNSPVCEGGTITLTAFVREAEAPVSYFWSGPGITSNNNTLQSPMITGATLLDVGKYYVTATVNGCSSSDSINVVVNSASVGGKTFNDTTVCYGTNSGTVTLAGNNGAVLNWEDSTEDVSWAIIKNTTTSLVFTGLKTTTWYRAVVQNGACDTAYSGITVITVIDSLGPVTVGADQLLCNQTTTNLSASNPPIGAGLWTQMSPSAPIATIVNPTASNTTVDDLKDTTYTFQWTVSGPMGCGSSSAQVQVINRPTVTPANAGPEQDICNFSGIDSVTLAGNLDKSRPFEQGLWTLIRQLPSSGTPPTFVTPNSPTSTFKFYAAGVYTLEWTIRDTDAACGPSSDTVQIKVSTPPFASFTVTPNPVCLTDSNAVVTVTNKSTNASSYIWCWGDGSPCDNFFEGTHAYHHSGADTIKLVAENYGISGVCIDSTDTTITIRPPVTLANAGSTQNVCNFPTTDTITLAGNSIPPTRPFEQGLWTILIGPDHPIVVSPNSPTSTFTFGSTGTYTLAWRISDSDNACPADSSSTIVNVSTPPVASFNVTPNPLCLTGGEATVNVINTSINATFYTWYWGDGTTSNFFAGLHIYNSSATDTITLVAHNQGIPGEVCTDIAKQTVTIRPPVTQAIAGPEQDICNFPTINSVTLAGNDPRLYEQGLWTVISRPTCIIPTFTPSPPNDPTTAFTFNCPGTYVLGWTISDVDSACQASSSTTTINVFAPPVAAFTTSTSRLCAGDTITVINTSTNANIYEWYWGDGSSSDIISGEHIYNSEGSYTITLIAENTADTVCIDSTKQTVAVFPLPSDTISVVGNAIFQYEPDYTFNFLALAFGADTTNYNYGWNFGDGNTGSGQAITYTYGDTGSYLVHLYTTDFSSGCVNTDTLTVHILYVPGYLYVPDAFCPGCTEGLLRTFRPLGLGLKSYHLTISTIWGKVLFETRALAADGSPSEAWDGQYNGQQVLQDSYRWQIEATYINGVEWEGMLYPKTVRRVKSGFLTLIR